MTLFQFQIGGVEEIAVRVTNATAAVLVDGTDQAWYVPWVQANENTGGGTPALTLDLFDGTTAYAIGGSNVSYVAKALTAGQSVLFDMGIFVPKGWKLRGKSGDAGGKIDFVGVKTKRQTT
jgi:hypothetical protein